MEEILASIRRIISDEDEQAKADADTAAPEAAAEPEPQPTETAADEAFAEAEADVFDAVPAATDFDAISVSDDTDEPAPEEDLAPAPDSTAEEAALMADIVEPQEAGNDVDFAESQIEPVPDIEPKLPETDATEDVLELSEAEVVEADVGFSDGGMDVEPPQIVEPAADVQPASFGDGYGDGALLSQDANAAVSAAFGSLANTILSRDARTLEDLVKEMLQPMLKAWLDENLPPLVERLVREEIERVSRGPR